MNPSNRRNGTARRWSVVGRAVCGGVMLIAAAASLPGCIAWEIRDGIREANGHMSNVDCRIDDANARLDLAHAHIDQTNALLIEVRTELAQTNTRLGEMEGQLLRANPMIDVTNKRLDDLMVLREVQATLTKINTQLKPLGDSLSALGSTVSFLGFGGDGGEGGGDGAEMQVAETADGAVAAEGAAVAATVDGEAAATAATANTEPTAGASPTGAATTASATGAPAGATTTASSRRSPNFLRGTWLLAYPTEDGAIGSGVGSGSAGNRKPGSAAGKASSLSAHAVIFLSSGEYILAEPEKPTIRGTWAREGKTLTMTAAPMGGTAATTGAQMGTTGNAATQGSATVVEILNNSPRQLTVKVGEEIRVYTRP